MRRSALALTAVLAIAAPAAAKEDVHAELDTAVRLSAPAGERMTVRWRLVDAQDRPFSAGGIYLRVSRCGGRAPLRVDPRDLGGGRFSARVRVPKGGIRALRVGLEGWRMTPGAEPVRADAFFEFVPRLRRRC